MLSNLQIKKLVNIHTKLLILGRLYYRKENKMV